MATDTVSRAPTAQPFLFIIPGSRETGRSTLHREVASLDEAVTLYESIRDESREGESTFAAGAFVAASGAHWRISYNGHVQPKAVRS